MLKEHVIMFLDAQSMTEENYDILDELEQSKQICKLTQQAVNTFIFYYDNGKMHVALSNLKMHTYKKRFSDNSPYIRL